MKKIIAITSALLIAVPVLVLARGGNIAQKHTDNPSGENRQAENNSQTVPSVSSFSSSESETEHGLLISDSREEATTTASSTMDEDDDADMMDQGDRDEEQGEEGEFEHSSSTMEASQQGDDDANMADETEMEHGMIISDSNQGSGSVEELENDGDMASHDDQEGVENEEEHATSTDEVMQPGDDTKDNSDSGESSPRSDSDHGARDDQSRGEMNFAEVHMSAHVSGSSDSDAGNRGRGSEGGDF
jgi:hypothetical protein